MSNKIAIIMDNTRSRVVNISSKDLFILREGVSYFNLGGYTMASPWIKKNKRDTFKKYLVDENGFFPSGIIHRVRHHLEKRGFCVDVLDNRILPKTNLVNYIMKCSEPTAYSDQDKCTAALLKAQQGIGQVPTGAGKTRIIKDTIQQLGVRSLVITPSTALKEQTTEYLEDCFGSEMVGMYDKRFDTKPVTVINYHSLGNTDPREWADFSLVEMDEFHHGTNNTIFDFNLTHLNNFYFRFGLTATNFTSDDASLILLEAVLSNTVFSMSTLDAIKKKYIVPIIPVFFDVPNTHLISEKDKPNPTGRRINAASVFKKDYKTFIDTNQARNEVALDTIAKMKGMGIPTLGLVKHIQHGREISAAANSLFLNGQDANARQNQDKIQAFNRLEIPDIIGTSVIGEGVDTKACGAVINLKGGKSKRELLQNIGRAARNFPGKSVGYYFDFIDRRQKNLYAHSRARMKIIREEFGIEPKVVKI